MWFNEFLDELKIEGIIYVSASPEVCFNRVKIRGRDGENIPLEYLQECSDYHDKWLNNCIIFDGDKDLLSIFQKVKDFIDSKYLNN